MQIKKNDEVLVISGEDRGRKGRVLKVLAEKERIVVEGVNFIKRHTRPSRSLPQGGIIKREAPIHVSNVMLICPKTNVPTRVRSQYLEATGKKSRQKARIAVKSGEIIQDQLKKS
jgi:large subunit ribosomal protein L24